MLNKRVLITGITGFLGSHLAKALIDHGYEVVALKRQSSELNRISTILQKLTLLDIENIEFSTPFLISGKIDAVIHTATNYGRNGESASDVFAANTAFPLKLLEAAIQADVGIFINSDSILDKCLNLYAISKNQFLQWGDYFSKKNKIHFINMKLEHFYGYGDDNSKFTAYVINNCISNTPALKLTLGTQRRDFIYIDDVVSAYLAVLNGENINKEWFAEYEIGSANSISIRTFVETVHRMTVSKTKLEFGSVPYRDNEVMDSQANISALEALGWRCKYNLEQGLKLTIEGLPQ